MQAQKHNPEIIPSSMTTNTAVAVYVPDEKSYIDQFWGLYQSVKEFPKNDAKFHFVVVCPEGAVDKLPTERCTVFGRNYELAEEFKQFNGNPYVYVNSFFPFVDDEVSRYIENNFIFCLKIDVDTFIAPNAHLLGVSYNEVKVGQGGYNNGPEVEKRLKGHCDSLGINYCRSGSLGSSWFGHAYNIVKLGKDSATYSQHLLQKDEVFKEGEGAWPGWYGGVVSMYGSHLAFCKQEHLTVQHLKLDVHPGEDLRLGDAYTLHCWHTDDFFSKFQFQAGNYDGLEVTEWQKSMKLSDFAFASAKKGREKRRKLFRYGDEGGNTIRPSDETVSLTRHGVEVVVKADDTKITIEITPE